MANGTFIYLKTLKSLSTLNALSTLMPANPLLDTFKACKEQLSQDSAFIVSTL